MSGVKGEQRETYWLQQRIGIAIQRVNAHSILAAFIKRGMPPHEAQRNL